MSHLTEQDRRRIENQLDAGKRPLAIARQEKRAHSTIVRELRKHRKEDETEQKRRKNYCKRKKSCFKRTLCKVPPGNCPGRCSQCKIIQWRKVEKIRHKIDPKCRVGRTLADYEKYCLEHPELPVVQMDSVIGSIGGKVLLTLLLDCGMMLAYLRDTNNAQSVIDYFDLTERKAGIERFRKMFPVILTDNGSEFSDPVAIETSPFTGERRAVALSCAQIPVRVNAQLSRSNGFEFAFKFAIDLFLKNSPSGRMRLGHGGERCDIPQNIGTIRLIGLISCTSAP